MADQLDELEGFKANVAERLAGSGVSVISVNGGEVVQLPKGGFWKNNDGTEDADGADPARVEELALEGRMHKLRKKVHPDVIEEVEAMDEEELRRRISQCETNVLESEKAKAADENLRALKEQVKEANAPYAETKKVQRAIAEYAACMLDKKGVA